MVIAIFLFMFSRSDLMWKSFSQLWNIKKTPVWVASFPFWCKIIDFSSLVQTNTFAASSLENRATPKSISAGRHRDVCVGTSQGAGTLRLHRFSFPHSDFQKQRNSTENQGKTSPQAKAAVATPTFLSPALKHMHTHFRQVRTHKHTSWQRWFHAGINKARLLSC